MLTTAFETNCKVTETVSFIFFTNTWENSDGLRSSIISVDTEVWLGTWWTGNNCSRVRIPLSGGYL